MILFTDGVSGILRQLLFSKNETSLRKSRPTRKSQRMNFLNTIQSDSIGSTEDRLNAYLLTSIWVWLKLLIADFAFQLKPVCFLIQLQVANLRGADLISARRASIDECCQSLISFMKLVRQVEYLDAMFAQTIRRSVKFHLEQRFVGIPLLH